MIKKISLLAGLLLLYFHTASANGSAGVPAWSREGQAQLCGQTAQAARSTLGARTAEKMQVMYFDTPELAGKSRGVYLRLRLKDGHAELTLKYRHADLTEALPGADCEVDVSRDHAVPSCSWETVRTLGEAEEVIRGKMPVEHLLSGQQKKVYEELMGSALASALLRHGPVQVERYKIPGPALGDKWRLELWQMGAQSMITEMSFRDDASAAPAAMQQELSEFVRRKGLGRCAQEISKTDQVLEAFRAVW